MLFKLFVSFFKIGLFTFGGGYAMIPLITDEALAYGLSSEQILNFIAVAESTPGPIAINMATFVGSFKAGFLGSMFATLGVVLPSFIIILLIATLIKSLLKYAGVKAFLEGVRPVVVGLIIGTATMLFMTVVFSFKRINDTVVFDYKALIIFGLIALINFGYKKIFKKKPSAIILIICSAVLGLIMYGLF